MPGGARCVIRVAPFLQGLKRGKRAALNKKGNQKDNRCAILGGSKFLKKGRARPFFFLLSVPACDAGPRLSVPMRGGGRGGGANNLFEARYLF